MTTPTPCCARSAGWRAGVREHLGEATTTIGLLSEGPARPAGASVPRLTSRVPCVVRRGHGRLRESADTQRRRQGWEGHLTRFGYWVIFSDRVWNQSFGPDESASGFGRQVIYVHPDSLNAVLSTSF
jgi:hypothetical protein